jgi:hypothetical protein
MLRAKFSGGPNDGMRRLCRIGVELSAQIQIETRRTGFGFGTNAAFGSVVP